MFKNKFSELSPGQQNDLENSIASFEIEGIVVTDQMLEDAYKIITGEATADELAEEFIKNKSDVNPFEWKFYLAERLHMEFDFRAEELGVLYHPKWIDEESFCIVDDQENACMDPSIYQFLESLKSQYSYKIDNDFTMRKTEDYKVSI